MANPNNDRQDAYADLGGRTIDPRDYDQLPEGSLEIVDPKVARLRKKSAQIAISHNLSGVPDPKDLSDTASGIAACKEVIEEIKTRGLPPTQDEIAHTQEEARRIQHEESERYWDDFEKRGAQNIKDQEDARREGRLF